MVIFYLCSFVCCCCVCWTIQGHTIAGSDEARKTRFKSWESSATAAATVVGCGATFVIVAHRCCAVAASFIWFCAIPPPRKPPKLVIVPRRMAKLARDAIAPFTPLLAFVGAVRLIQEHIFCNIFVHISPHISHVLGIPSTEPAN